MAEWVKRNGQSASIKRLPYLSTWKIFSRLPEEEKEKLFNELRNEALLRGFMEKESKK